MADADTLVTDPRVTVDGRPILARVPTLSPFVSLRRLSATILPLTAMPLTTPFLPLTVSAASFSSSNSSHTGDTLDSGPDSDEPQLRFDLEALSAVSEAHATTAPPPAPPSTPAARPSSRRLTFTRFPLLRKGSRELTRISHLRASSVSAAAPPSRADSPFLATGAPRSSRSSFARPRPDLPLHESTTVSDPSVPASLRPGSFGGAEPAHHFDTQDTSLQQPVQPAKMHQTSSRLLRMTDDERPYTRVSASTGFLHSHAPSCTCLLQAQTLHARCSFPIFL